MNNRELGKIGEEIASKYLEQQGIKILKKNYNTKYGEIDLIGIENKTIIFIEVKLRNNQNFGLPGESVNFKKLKKIKNTALCYLDENNFNDKDCRFDIICLMYDKFLNKYCIEWLKNQYFD